MHGGVLLVANTVPYFGADTVMMLLCAVSGVPAYTALLTTVCSKMVAEQFVHRRPSLSLFSVFVTAGHCGLPRSC